jgi:hypothetical protein
LPSAFQDNSASLSGLFFHFLNKAILRHSTTPGQGKSLGIPPDEPDNIECRPQPAFIYRKRDDHSHCELDAFVEFCRSNGHLKNDSERKKVAMLDYESL